MVNIGNEWDELLADQFRSEYYKKLRAFLVDEYNRYNVYPPADCIFNALKYTPYSKVKAVLLGQDPYHGAGQAHGLCFSVKRGVMPPPSLKNIFTEIHNDLGIDFDMSRAYRLGTARSSHAEHLAYSPRGHGRKSQGQGLGDTDRQDNRAFKRARRAYGIHTVGKQRKVENAAYYKSEARGIHSGTPKPAVGV